MTIQELNNKYKEEICPYCKGQCEKGIVITADTETIQAKCVDYEKDKSKVGDNRYKKPLERTAKLEKTLMGLSSSSWG